MERATNAIGKVSLRTDAEPQKLLLELVMSPLIYMRLGALLFSIIVFGCVSDQVYRITGGGVVCDYNDSNACSFAVTIGVIAFLLCLAFLVKDFLLIIVDFSQAMHLKKVILIADAGVCGFWAFMWFVSFCFTTNKRHISNHTDARSTTVQNCVNAGIAFSFFSVIVWVAMVGFNVFLFIRMYQGKDRDDPGTRGTTGGYASFPDENNNPSPYPDGDDGVDNPPYSPPEY